MSESTHTGDGDSQEIIDQATGDGSQEGTEPTVEQLQAELANWKSHARKHEGRAKDERSKATQFEARVTELESQLTDMQSAQVQAVREAYIDAYKLDDTAAALLTATDIDGLKTQIASITALRGTPPAGASAPLEGTRPTEKDSGTATFGALLGRALRDRAT